MNQVPCEAVIKASGNGTVWYEVWKQRTVEKEKFLSRFFEVVIDICQK